MTGEQKQAIAGGEWAQRVYKKKLGGADDPEAQFAALRAIEGIADSKLFTRLRRSTVKVKAPLNPRDRAFWRGVLAWVLREVIRFEDPEQAARIDKTINKALRFEGQIAGDEKEWVEDVSGDSRIADLFLEGRVVDGELQRVRGVYLPVDNDLS